MISTITPSFCFGNSAYFKAIQWAPLSSLFANLFFTCFLVVWVLCSSPINLSGQSSDTYLIDGTYEDQSIRQILNSIEDQYPVVFYHQHDLDMIRTISFDSVALPIALNQLLPDSLGFMVYRSYGVVIGPKRILNQFYTADFYKALRENRVSSRNRDEHTIVAGDPLKMAASGQATIKGLVKDLDNGQPVIGATLYITQLKQGFGVGSNGQFSMELPLGTFDLSVQSIGFEPSRWKLIVYGDADLNLTLTKQAITLDEVIVESTTPDENVSSVLIGVEQISPKSFRKLPTFLGEVDLVKSLLLLPGVSSVGEGASGFNVRGGSVDQNLIMQDEAFVFNSSHALGFFSTFNSDMIGKIRLYKGAIPAQFGGRLSSVLEVEMKDGDFERYRANGGIGLVSSRVNVQGPIKKEHSSFYLGGRITYSDWVLNSIRVPELKTSSVSFSDINARITQKFGDRTRLVVAGYYSFDSFDFSDQFGYDYQTGIIQSNIRHSFKPEMINSLSLIYSTYQSKLLEFDVGEAFQFDNQVRYFKIKEHLKYQPRDNLSLDLGGSYIFYWVDPGTIQPSEAESAIVASSLERETGAEMAVFTNMEWVLNPKLSISSGLRFQRFENKGPQQVFEYADNNLPSLNTIIDTLSIAKGENLASFNSLEPRASLRYNLDSQTSIKLGYARTSQFIHQISNTAAATPVDVWQLSDNFIRPQKSHNYSLGVFRNFSDNRWETSLEGFYRDIDRMIEYRDFAKLLANEQLETEVLSGVGRSYGLEFSVKGRRPHWNGWISYTYSRTERKVNNSAPEFSINNGDWFPANFDKPHDLTLVSNFEITKRHTIAVNFNYSTGRPITAPVGNFSTGNVINAPLYSQRNALRIPNYHRLDVAYTISEGFKKSKRWKSSWTLTLFNVYGRKNPFTVFFTQPPGQPLTAQRLAILGSVFPAITYNFKFE